MKLDTLFENFDLLMDAPNAVPKMRDLILQLAVQGELVEQDSTDEPASELLKRIKAEKEKLIAEGKIKKQKPLQPIGEDEIPYELPQGWKWSRLGKILTFAYGKGLTKQQRNEKGNIPVYGSNGIVGYHDQYLINRSCIIIGRKGSSGALNICYTDSWTTDVAYYCSPPKELDLEYIYITLKALELEKLGKGIKPGLNRNEAYLEILSIPPLSEQKRIISKVDQLMQLCDQLDTCQEKASTKHTSLNDAALEKLLSSKTIDEFANHWQFLCDNFDLIYNDPAHANKLCQAILQLAVQGKLTPQDPNDEPASELLKRIKAEKEKLIAEGKLKKQKPLLPITEDEIAYELPQGWEWVKLQDVFDVRDGTHDTPKYVMDGFPLVTSKNLKNGRVDFSDIKYISEEDHIKISIRSKVDQGDILFAMIGSIGNPVIVEEDNFSIKNVALFKYYDVNLTTNRYLFYFLKFASVEMQDISLGGVQSFVSLGFLRNYLFPLPPYPEQKRIVAKVDQLMRHCDELEIRLNQSKNNSGMLMDAVLYEAFS